MDIGMDKPPHEMTLAALADRCLQEMSKFRRKEQNDDQYCLEIFRRAILREDQAAWDMLYNHYAETIRIWFRRHSKRDVALRYSSEEDYVSDTFMRFWKTVSKEEMNFTSLAGALSYLHLCLHCAIMDTLREFAKPSQVPLPEYEQLDDPKFGVDALYHESELWEVIKSILDGEEEQRREKVLRLAYLLFYCNLKPREIIHNCPDEFKGVNEVYSLRRNIMERIMRNADKFRWKLSDGEQ